MSLRCYAQRQLNPLQGVLQVVESDDARAFSANGVLWEIQVLGEHPEHTWRSDNQQSELTFFHWGWWSQARGLQQVVANPLQDIGRMRAAADTLLSALPDALANLPFDLQDTWECWACDAQANPIALLSSAKVPQQLTTPTSASGTTKVLWKASDDSEAFDSPTLQQAGITSAHASYLEHAINQHCTAQRWIESNPCQPEPGLPQLGLREHWPDPQLARLVADYLAWQAPYLLTWNHLGQRRAALEQAAAARPVLVDQLHRLYPETHDPAQIAQIRVQARLLRAE